MTTTALWLLGDEQGAADAAHWARFRTARLVPASGRRPGQAPAVDAPGLVITEHGPSCVPGTTLALAADPAALAALLVGARAVRDGLRILVATADGEDFAAGLAAAIAALGHAVTCTSRAAGLAFGLHAAPRGGGGAPAAAAPTTCVAQAAT